MNAEERAKMLEFDPELESFRQAIKKAQVKGRIDTDGVPVIQLEYHVMAVKMRIQGMKGRFVEKSIAKEVARLRRINKKARVELINGPGTTVEDSAFGKCVVQRNGMLLSI